MKAVIKKENFVKCVNVVERFVPFRSSNSTLSCVFLKASESGVELSATDLDTAATAKTEAETVMEGSALIPGKILCDMASKLPEGDIILEKADNNRVNVSSGNFFMALPNVEGDFPMAALEKDGEEITLSQQEFRNMIKKTMFAAATESISKPWLNGVLLEAKNGSLNFVALDGFRIAWAKIPFSGKDIKVILPKKFLNEVIKLFSDSDDFKLIIAKNRVVVETKDYTLQSRTLEGSFIDYEKLININGTINIEVSADDVLGAIDRAMVLAKQANNNVVNTSIRDEKLIVSVENESGSIHNEIHCIKKGEDLDMAFNAVFLLEAFRAQDTPDLELYLQNSPTSPLIISPKDDESYVNYILPVRI